jgi:hypothetical protein
VRTRTPPHRLWPTLWPTNAFTHDVTRQTVFLVRPFPAPPDGRPSTTLGGFESRWVFIMAAALASLRMSTILSLTVGLRCRRSPTRSARSRSRRSPEHCISSEAATSTVSVRISSSIRRRTSTPRLHRCRSAATTWGSSRTTAKLYAIAGRIDDFNHNTSYVDIYDPKTDRWAAGAAMPSQRSGMAVAPLRRPHPRDRRRARRRNLHQQRSVRPAHGPLGNPSSAPRRTTRHRPP